MRGAERAVVALAAVMGGVAAQDPAPAPTVDLSGDSYASIHAIGGSGDTRDWFQRVELRGFVAGAYVHTESRSKWPGGAFVVDQASLFLDADVRDDIGVVLELKFDELPLTTFRTGETYIDLRRVAAWDDGKLGVKIGRFDLPFGEYYLLQHAPDNPLVSYPVAMPYGYDEGVEAYGSWRRLQFVGAITEGHQERDGSQETAPAVTVRVGAELGRGIYTSASYMHVRDTARSALCFSGTFLTPVGMGAPSALGVSPSPSVRADLGVVDLRWQPTDTVRLRASVGHGRLDDAADAFDRDFTWFVFEPSWRPCPALELVGRWSEVGTYDDGEGLRFEGRQFANGSADMGFDLSRLRRLSFGVGWQVATGVAAKLEVGIDHLEAIDASPFSDDDRAFVAAQVVAWF
jgi:hypothetical protein